MLLKLIINWLWFCLINVKGGEKIKKRRILISLMFICFIMLSLNFVAANNETMSGNDSVSSITEPILQSSSNDVQIEDNLSSVEGKIIEIRQDNYESYFDARTGKILESASISSGDTLKIGNISERAFVIDRQLTLMPITPDDQIKNGFIHLKEVMVLQLQI